MSDLDGGSAAPPTADVPTEDRATDLRTPARWLNDPEFAGIEILDYDGWRVADWRTPVTVQEFRRRLWLCTITGPVRRSPDPSGVAGEPEATTKESCCPEFARNGYSHTEICPAFDTAAADPAVAVAERRAIESPTDGGVRPAASTTAGGVTVPDEAVEKFWTTFADAGGQFHANGRAVTPAIRAGLAAAAPLIAARVARELLDAVSADADPLVDRLAALLCDDCDPGPCHDSISEAGRALKFLANAGRLLPEGGQTRTEWGMRDRTGKVYPARGEQDARELASTYEACDVQVVRQLIFTGPWVAVDQEATDG